MTYCAKVRFVNNMRRKQCVDVSCLCSAWRVIAFVQAVFIALIVATVPAFLQAQPQSNSLPGGLSVGKPANSQAGINISIAVAVDMAMDMKHGTMMLNMNPIHIILQIVPGKSVKLIAPVKNLMDAPVTIKRVVLEDKTGAFVFGGGEQSTVLLAPTEKYEIPVTFTAIDVEGKAHIRIVATTGNGRDEVKDILVGYSRKSNKTKPDSKPVLKVSKAELSGLNIGNAAKFKGVVSELELDAPSVEFTNFVPGQPAKLSIPLMNPMNSSITIKEIVVEDKSGALTLGGASQNAFPLAPGERYDIPVTLTAAKIEGKARIRVVATSEGTKKRIVKYIDVSYSRKGSQDTTTIH